jgi:hypothetical protein
MSHSADEPFVLDWEISSLGDEDYFAYLVKFPGSEDILGFDLAREYELPARIYFSGNFAKLKVIDYPYNDVRWPLMSQLMRTVLQKTGKFQCREIPVTMLDDTVPKSELFPKGGEPDAKYALERFAAVQLLQHLDAFDWDRSEFRRSEHVPTLVTRIKKLALKPVVGGYPPLFRLSACPTLLFVSAEARSAMENEHISGVEFIASSAYRL